MKKTLLLAATLIVICVTASAQNIINPYVEQIDAPNSTITKIETDKQYTIVSFVNTASADNAWIILNKEIFIQTDANNQHYDFVKAEGIPVAPETRHTFEKAGDKISFKVYFKKLPATAKTIDIIERAGRNNDGSWYFNFYNVSLTQQGQDGEHVKVTEVALAPPPINEYANGLEGTELTNMMGAMGPMYASLIRSMLDAQLTFYKQPGKLTEVAKVHKQYFDALIKEGFTYDQAIKILTSSPLIQMTGASGK